MNSWIRPVFISLVAVASAAALHAASAVAQAYPDKPVRFLVGYAAGGANDIIARMVGQGLSQVLGQQFIVDNRTGAAGLIANSIVATADANGYTILLVSPTFTYETSLHSKLPYDPDKAFYPVSLLAQSPFVILTNNAFQAKSIGDLIDLAKASPGQINYAHAGNGSFIHLIVAMFGAMAKIDITGVPYKGGGPAVTALTSGETQLLSTSILPALGNIKAGRLRALAVTSVKRSPLLPQVPTVAESGVEGYEAQGWWGVVVRSGTPKPVVARLSDGIGRAMSDQEMRSRLGQQGVEAIGNSPGEFAAHIRSESVKWKKVIREAKVKVN